MRKIILLFIGFPVVLSAQQLSGRITTTDGKPIAYASIYVPELHKGTTANSDGVFILPLPEGEHNIVVQYLGYAKYRTKISLDKTAQLRLEVKLQPQALALPEVIVTASGEDPAAFIMRKAIALGPYYRNQLEEYRARVYVKGTGLPEKIPALLRSQLKKDGIREGRYIVTETLSDIHYRRGEPLQTKVISTRTSSIGNEDVPMQFATLSLYNDINGVISPLSRDAFAIYRFRLEGTYLEDGRTVSCIRVIPRRKGQDVYTGTIMIREGSWNLQAVDLRVTTNLFDLDIRQVYQEVEPLVWMPVSHDYKLTVDALGGKGTFRYVATLSDIKVRLNPQLDHKRFAAMMEVGVQELASLNESVSSSGKLTATRNPKPANPRLEQLAAKENLSRSEMREMNRLISMEARTGDRPNLEIKPRNTELADSAKLRTPEYWVNNRPVPLTAGEAESFGEDSVSGARKDSVSRNPMLSNLLFGKNNYKISEKATFSHNGFADYSAFGFNTVDGLLFSQRVGMVYNLPGARRLKPFAEASYAFARRALNYSLEAEFLSGPLSRTTWTLAAGKLASDYNVSSSMPPFMNAITTLFGGRNWLKLYENRFVSAAFSSDIVNGLTFRASFELADRSPLQNNSTFVLYAPQGHSFTSNLPQPFAHRNELFESHRAALASISLAWTPEHYYRIRDGRKQMLRSRFPTFSLKYKGGLPNIVGSKTQFSHWEFALRHAFARRLLGSVDYGFVAGWFADTAFMAFQDFRHFRADPLIVGETWQGLGFRSAEYYAFSTNKPYAGAYARLSSRTLLVKRIPALALRNFSEQIRFAARFEKGSTPVFEFGYGFQQLFFFADAEVYVATGPALFRQMGINIGIPFTRLMP